MAYVHEIKFYTCQTSGKLKVALYDQPPFFCNEFWIKNVEASELGFTCLPKGLKLEQKYKVELLGIKPFHASKPEFDFLDKCAEATFYAATKAALKAVIPHSDNGLVDFLSLLGKASAYAAHTSEYDMLPHVRAARDASSHEEALSKCPQDVAEVIRRNAPTTVSIKRKSNSKGSRYKCYDNNGVLLGRVFGASGQRYWKEA